jgi:hypothetical protein
MAKERLTIEKAKNTPAGGVLIGKDKVGQTIIPEDGSLGGFLVGKLHREGGIQAVNKGNGQPLEMQSNEVVITSPAVADTTKKEFQGKMMTNREILSKINSDAGGVSFEEGGKVVEKESNSGHLAEGFSVRDIANIHKVNLATLKKQVIMGMKAESEHTSSKREQLKIVKDHLFENPKYYTLLKKVGLKKGGSIEKENLVKDSEKGDTPARDLNNYNDLLDVEADGAVGGDNGLSFEEGGNINEPENILKPKTHEEFKISLEHAINNNFDSKTIKNIQADFFTLVVRDNPEDNLAKYYEAIQVLPSNQRDYFQDYINEVKLYNELERSICFYLPEDLRKEHHVKKIDFSPIPTSENLGKITDLFVSRDELRPRFSGVHFNLERESIECTNMHIALVIKEKPHLEKSGTFLLGKAKEWYHKKFDSIQDKSDELDVNYPIIENIIPNDYEEVITVNSEKLYSYLRSSKYFTNKQTQEVVISFANKDGLISNRNFNSGLLLNCLEAMLMLGCKNVDLCFSQSKNRTLVIIPEGNSRKVSGYAINTDLTLIMPIRRDIYPEKLPVYDLNNQVASTIVEMIKNNSPEIEEVELEENKSEEVEPIIEEVEILKSDENHNSEPESKENKNEIPQALETLELLLETVKGKDKKEIKDAIEVLKIILEQDSFELGGKFYENDLSFRPIETPLN